MNNYKIDKEKLMSILEMLNTELKENMLSMDLFLYGGSYMTLISDIRPATRDLDCMFSQINETLLDAILKNIGETFCLDDDWFNSEIAGPLSYLKKQDLATFKTLSNLSVFTPSQEQMLAMKILAGRPEPAKDFIDAKILCLNLNITTRQQLMQVFLKYIDVKYIGERQRNFIKYLGEDLGYDW